MLATMPDGGTLLVALACAVAVLFGGVVKGATGVGLPMIAVPLMLQLVPAPLAITLMAVPVLASNLLQLDDRRLVAGAVARFWTLLLALLVATVVGANALAAASARAMNIGLGLVTVGMAVMQMRQGTGPRRPVRNERLLSPAVGLVAGLLGGISSFAGPPLLAYLLRLELASHAFVVTISLFYICAAVPLYVSLIAHGAVEWPALVASLALVAPAYGGLLIGRRLRRTLDERQFRGLIIAVLMTSGLGLLVKAALA